MDTINEGVANSTGEMRERVAEQAKAVGPSFFHLKARLP